MSQSPSFRSFTILLTAQAISLFGSTLTGFALGVWAYQEAGASVTIYAMIALANGLPIVLLSPIAGAAADRWNRKKIIISSQISAILVTAILALLYWLNQLEVWHIIALVAFNSIFSAFVLPTIAATLPLMVPKDSLIRANGMISLAFGTIELAAPAISGSLYIYGGLKTIFLIDILTFMVGLSVIILTYIPQHRSKNKDIEEAEKEHLWQSVCAGWHYLRSNEGLLSMVIFYSVTASIMLAIAIMIQPMVLAFADAKTLGFIMSFAGSGILFGSIFMIAIKNTNHHMPVIFTAAIVLSLGCIFTPISTTPMILAIGGFLIMCCFPIFDGNNRALFQRKVEPEMLGRVIGLRNFSLGICQCLMVLVAGPFVDYFFEPGMQSGGYLTSLFADIFGEGKGRGIALSISLLGIISIINILIAFSSRKLRNLDTLLDDVKHEPSLANEKAA